MKALVCELCGGNDLVKDGGYFVCQSCGTKYTVEEAKKMMIEGTVNVQGTVKVDRSSESRNILRNADSTFEVSNYKEAFDLYSQVLNNDPDNTHAILYRALSSAWQSTVKDCHIVEINMAAKRAFEIQHNQYGDTKKYFDFCYDASMKINALISAISQMYIAYYNKANPPTVVFGAYADTATANLAAEVKKTLQDGTTDCCIVNSNVINYITSKVSDYSDTDKELWDELQTMAQNCNIFRTRALMSIDPQYTELSARIQLLSTEAIKSANAKKQRLIVEYWQSHADEKAALDKERSELVSFVSALENEKNNLPGQSEKRNLEQKIENLNNTKKSLGLFKVKEKKEIQASIDEATSQLNQIAISLQTPLADIQSKINTANNRIVEIDTEFNKDRR